jgi:hypothetical protein
VLIPDFVASINAILQMSVDFLAIHAYCDFFSTSSLITKKLRNIALTWEEMKDEARCMLHSIISAMSIKRN